ncbi:tRNA glutamyl-Q(34) synthetase GluQRS [Tropicimonas marinistellae]|uniref:tRNA glutamyl-Q(34) synthetase GluQRS n=1 Tax=Tropicimonas marinistellae TaxID=1739787 RepID=UPI00082EE922|nr:tRNA glutamyl-Q(34) synthetase GluQRS [Tropicimonas marinistellae]
MITRFAPSPTGPLHLGHAYSAVLAYELAREAGGTFLLRIEDIDRSRARQEWESLIYRDLHWLGLDWPVPVLRQSERQRAYRDALDGLWRRGLLYPCRCRRRDIAEASRAPQEGAGPIVGPDGIVYPGTCRNRPRRGFLPDDALRLDMEKAVEIVETVSFIEDGRGSHGETGAFSISATHLIEHIGDIVLARRDMGTSYHLAVVLDDAAQAITHVVRGEDLFPATAIHVLLQKLMNLPTPRYHHHRLIRDDSGKRLAKRDDARAISKYRDDGVSPLEVRHMVGL